MPKFQIPNPLGFVVNAFDKLINAQTECHRISEIEQTKREHIRTFRDINVKAIEESSAILRCYLQGIFQERAFVIQEMFDRLDKSLSSGDTQMASFAINAIVSIAKQSPLAGVHELIANINDPNVKMIEI